MLGEGGPARAAGAQAHGLDLDREADAQRYPDALRSR